MSDFSLVPVDHQPDFENVSLVPVDHDPFSAEGVTLQPRAQQAPTKPAQPQPPATGVGHPNVSAPANSTQASELGESWNPDTENSDLSGPNRSTASTLPPNDVPFKPFGQLKPATFTPTQQIGHHAADALTALGMQPYTANDLTKRIGDLLGLTPLGVAGSALDLIDAKRRGDLPGVVTAAAGMIPGTKGIARGVAEEAGAALRRAAESPEILPEELAGQTRSQIRDLAADKGLVPKGDPLHPDYPRRWNDPVTNERRLRLDRGHIDTKTGQPYDIENTAVDHVHAYGVNGIRFR
jgi:hypothetical protein